MAVALSMVDATILNYGQRSSRERHSVAPNTANREDFKTCYQQIKGYYYLSRNYPVAIFADLEF